MPLIESEQPQVEAPVSEQFAIHFQQALQVSKDIRSKIKTEEEFNEQIEPYLEGWVSAWSENATPKMLFECPIGVTYFKKFLQSEMNTENLSGYLDFKAFMDIMMPQNREEEWSKVKSEINKIKEAYLDTNAPQELNISSKTRQVWLEHIKKADSISKPDDVLEWKLKIKDDLYDLVQNEIMSNIMDPFSRFTSHPLFKEIVRWVFSGKMDQLRERVYTAGKKDIIVLNSLIEWDKDLNSGNPLTIVVDLLKDFVAIFKKEEIWLQDGNIDYEKIQTEQDCCGWGKLNQRTCALQGVDLSLLTDSERKAFFVNLYNLIMLHGVLSMNGDIGNVLERAVFNKNMHYNVGGEMYSLETLNTMLRPNIKDCAVCQFFKKGLKKKDARQKLTNFHKDINVIFSLIDLTSTSPSLQVFDAKNVEEVLNNRVSKYVLDRVKVKDEERSIYIPNIFAEYYRDFKVDKASNDESIKLFLSKYIKFPFEYKLVRQEQDCQVDFSACKLTQHSRSVIQKRGTKLQQTIGLRESKSISQQEAWMNAIEDSGLAKNATYWFKSYINVYSSGELLTWLENNKDANISRKDALAYLNEMYEKRMFYILTGQKSVVDDSKQLLQLQKSLIPIGFGKVLNFGPVKTIGKYHTSKRFMILYQGGLAIFSNNRLVEALVFVPTVKYFLTTQKDGVSWSMTILPYFQMTLSATKEDRKIWMEKFALVDKYVEIKHEELGQKASFFKKYFI